MQNLQIVCTIGPTHFQVRRKKKILNQKIGAAIWCGQRRSQRVGLRKACVP